MSSGREWCFQKTDPGPSRHAAPGQQGSYGRPPGTLLLSGGEAPPRRGHFAEGLESPTVGLHVLHLTASRPSCCKLEFPRGRGKCPPGPSDPCSARRAAWQKRPLERGDVPKEAPLTFAVFRIEGARIRIKVDLSHHACGRGRVGAGGVRGIRLSSTAARGKRIRYFERELERNMVRPRSTSPNAKHGTQFTPKEYEYHLSFCVAPGTLYGCEGGPNEPLIQKQQQRLTLVPRNHA